MHIYLFTYIFVTVSACMYASVCVFLHTPGLGIVLKHWIRLFLLFVPFYYKHTHTRSTQLFACISTYLVTPSSIANTPTQCVYVCSQNTYAVLSQNTHAVRECVLSQKQTCVLSQNKHAVRACVSCWH